MNSSVKRRARFRVYTRSSSMAKYKAAGTRRQKTSTRSAAPCLVIIILGFTVVFLLFYLGMQSGK